MSHASYHYKKVAFLDTNTIHYVRLCLSYAQERVLHPFGPASTSSWDDLNPSIRTLSRGLRQHLKIGIKVLQFLEHRGVDVKYSRISEIELIAGMIRGKAIESAARDEVPHRMLTRMPESEIADRVSEQDLSQVGAALDELPSLLDALNITITATDRNRESDVLGLAARIARLRYLEPVDVVIYAEAVLAQADYLITSDGYLRTVTNDIRNTKRAPFGNIRTQVIQIAADALLQEPGSVILPDAPKKLVRS